MQQAEFENAEGVLPVLLVDDEIDAAILAAGFLPTASMPIERMRCLVADLSMAVANAVAIDDEAKFVASRSDGSWIWLPMRSALNRSSSWSVVLRQIFDRVHIKSQNKHVAN